MPLLYEEEEEEHWETSMVHLGQREAQVSQGNVTEEQVHLGPEASSTWKTTAGAEASLASRVSSAWHSPCLVPQNRNEMIAYLKDQLQEMKAKTDMENRYVKKDAELQVAQVQKKCSNAENDLQNEIDVSSYLYWASVLFKRLLCDGEMFSCSTGTG